MGRRERGRARTVPQAEMSTTEFENRLREQPPSVKLIVFVLQKHEPMSHGELQEEAMLHHRTMTYAVERARSEGLITAGRMLSDARKKVYRVATTRDDDHPPSAGDEQG